MLQPSEAKIQCYQAWLQAEQFWKLKIGYFAFAPSARADSPFLVVGIYKLLAHAICVVFFDTHLSQPFPPPSKIHLLLAREQLMQARP